MRMGFISLTLLAVMLGSLQSADACRGPQWEYRAFLRELNEAANAASVVVEVEVVELFPYRYSNGKQFTFTDRAKARVVRSIKGAKEGTLVTLAGNCSSCGGCFTVDDIGKTRLVAGEFKRDSAEEFLAPWYWDFNGKRVRE